MKFCFTHIVKVCFVFKGTVMQIKKTLTNDHLHVSKVSWKFRIPTIYVAVIYPWNSLFSEKVAYFLTAFSIFSVYKKTLRLNKLKTRTAMNAKILVFVICVKVIIYLLLSNLHDCTFKKQLLCLYSSAYA